jgi:hypothetical protein
MRVDAPALDDQDISAVVEFCRSVSAAFADEREHYDDVAERFARTQRRRLFRARPFDPPTGAGFDLPMLIEQLLPLAALLWQAAAEEVAGQAVDRLEAATASRVRNLMRRRPETQLTSRDRLTAEDEAHVFKLIVGRAITLGIEQGPPGAVPQCRATMRRCQ